MIKFCLTFFASHISTISSPLPYSCFQKRATSIYHMVMSTNRSHPICFVQIFIPPIISWNAPHPHLISITKQQSWQLFTEQWITTDYYFILIALEHRTLPLNYCYTRGMKRHKYADSNSYTQIHRHKLLHTDTQTLTLNISSSPINISQIRSWRYFCESKNRSTLYQRFLSCFDAFRQG